jgi:hypothetical protein
MTENIVFMSFFMHSSLVNRFSADTSEKKNINLSSLLPFESSMSEILAI